MLLSTILFALALSLDCLGVGISYGLQGMRISWRALGVICCCSGAVLAISMTIGQLLTGIIPIYLVQYLGAGILIGLGVYLVLKNLFKTVTKTEGAFFELTIRSLGIVIQILKEPANADLDRSGMINSREALFLGMALSLDSFGAGIGASLMGLEIFSTSACVGLSAFVFISLGRCAGYHMGSGVGYHRLSLFPGLILILIGFYRLFL